MRTGIIYDDTYLRHDTRAGHPERPARLKAIVDRLNRDGLWGGLAGLSPKPAPVSAITAVHAVQYVEHVRRVCEAGGPFLDSDDTPVGPESYTAALLAAGGALVAADAVIAGQVDNAFCLIRPPGHHAEHDHAMGFCLFNNVAVVAQHLIDAHHLRRVAVVDWDVHHGNGTQHLFESRSDVLFISLHEDPRVQYPGTGFAWEQGQGAGTGYTLNIPFEPGTGDAQFKRAFSQQVVPKLESYQPEALLISAGFDAARGDPLGHLDLTPDCFAWMTHELKRVADHSAHGRVVSLLEGGYNLDALSACAAAHVAALLE